MQRLSHLSFVQHRKERLDDVGESQIGELLELIIGVCFDRLLDLALQS